jgi:hypothetical protein
MKPFPVTVMNLEGFDDEFGIMEVMLPRKVTAANPFIIG